ncbi:MAG TPA: hypothetical protein VFY58_02960 [Nocardioides sp.]|nr:hypothetical protein [Nocardioides sp.]
MWWASLILGVAGIVVMARGVALIVDGRRAGRRPSASDDADQRMVASLRVVAGVKLVNRGALLLVVALALFLTL